jgi:hypothetical protein
MPVEAYAGMPSHAPRQAQGDSSFLVQYKLSNRIVINCSRLYI